MKTCKITLAGFIFLFLININACKSIEVQPENPNSSVNDLLEIPQEVKAEHQGGNITIDIKSNTQWEIHAEKGWTSVVPDKGYKDGQVTLKVEANEGVWERGMTLVFKTANLSDTLKIFQDSGHSPLRADKEGPANCFIVNPENDVYAFVPYIPEQSEKDITKAELVWQDKKNLVKAVEYNSTQNLIGFILNKESGNALIAAKNNQEEILWSWHIWVTDYDPEHNSLVTLPNRNQTSWTFMDRNLGALTSISGDFRSLGLLYQWGRKDPFTGNISDTEEEGKTYDIDGNLLPTAPEKAQQFGTVDLSVRHPDVFYTISYKTNDWTSPSNDDLWGGISMGKSIYDPCPAGWKIPVCDEKQANPYEFIFDGSAIWSDRPAGYFYKEWWFPCGGTRIYESGNLSYNIGGGYGGLWVGTAGSANKDQENFPALYGQYLFLIDGILFHTSKDARSQGMSVRCVRE